MACAARGIASVSRVACAAEVAVFWLVVNGLARDPSMREAVAAYENVRVAEAGNGPGVYEAVITTLAGSPAA